MKRILFLAGTALWLLSCSNSGENTEMNTDTTTITDTSTNRAIGTDSASMDGPTSTLNGNQGANTGTDTGFYHGNNSSGQKDSIRH